MKDYFKERQILAKINQANENRSLTESSIEAYKKILEYMELYALK